MKRSAGPWLVLAVILAAPALLFRNWSKGLVSSKTAAGSVKAVPHDVFGPRSQGAPPASPEPTAPSAAPPTSPAAPKGPYAFGAAGKDVRPSPAAPGGNTRATEAAQNRPAGQETLRPGMRSAPPARSTASPAALSSASDAQGAGRVAPSTGTAPQAQAADQESRLPRGGDLAPGSPGPSANPIVFNPHTERDPMLSPSEIQTLRERGNPPAEPEPVRRAARRKIGPEQKVRVSGIISAGGSVRAIINDQIHKVGDTVAGSKVIKITANAVVFQNGKKTFRKVVPK